MKENTISMTELASKDYGYLETPYSIVWQNLYLPAGYYAILSLTPNSDESIMVSGFSLSLSKQILVEIWQWFETSAGSSYGVFEELKYGRISHLFVEPNTGDKGDTCYLYIYNHSTENIFYDMQIYYYTGIVPENFPTQTHATI